MNQNRDEGPMNQNQDELLYGIEDNPPLGLSFLLAF